MPGLKQCSDSLVVGHGQSSVTLLITSLQYSVSAEFPAEVAETSVNKISLIKSPLMEG